MLRRASCSSSRASSATNGVVDLVTKSEEWASSGTGDLSWLDTVMHDCVVPMTRPAVTSLLTSAPASFELAGSLELDASRVSHNCVHAGIHLASARRSSAAATGGPRCLSVQNNADPEVRSRARGAAAGCKR
eukprot:scaffold133232_cov28-Tisochrysis_lutea.AAC.6